ncbi:family 78 glycoside hydrolase catalytic domain [Verrucomicrobiota bacterium sgz303538]
MKWPLLFLVGVFSLAGIAPAQDGALRPVALSTEYLTNPQGIDATQPRLQWKLESPRRAEKQTAYRILAASTSDKLMQDEGDIWDSSKVASDATSQIVYAGKPLTARQQVFWKVQVWDKDGRASHWSEPAQWSMGLLAPDDWKAQWISFHDESPVWTSREKLQLPPARQYRKEFQPTDGKPIKRVTIYATALGIYELQLNGSRVGDAYFAPGWTDYRQRVYYRSYDVSQLMQNGANCLGATVADGWYSGYVGYGLFVGYGPNKVGRNIYGKTPALLAQLEIEYADGSRQIIPTDASWKVTSDGPIREADLLMGESYDARKEMADWSRPGFDDSAWKNAIQAEENGSTKATWSDTGGKREVELGFVQPPKLQAYSAQPVRVTQELKPVSVKEQAPGVFIFDMGQNFAGNVRLSVKGPAGTQIRLRYGEMLHSDGRLMTENLRRARATDFYTLSGNASGETWTPQFTFHGFQFVEVTGWPGKPDTDAITGLVIHSDTPLTSQFECSDPMANQLFKNIVWTQRANFIDLPTDCPQRDERMGWMGDAQIYVRTATYNADVAAFFTKWMNEVEEAQLPSGAYPDYCPWPMQHGHAFAPAWTDAGVIVPWTIWQVYGDTRIIERHWSSLKRFMDWREKESRNNLGVVHGNEFGDWLAITEKTPIDYIDSVYLGYTAKLMSEMARAIGKQEDAAHYSELFDKVRTAFAQKYVKPDGSLNVDTQTAYALALFTGLMPEDLRAKAGEQLAAKIHAAGTRMGTGFLGTRPILPVLTSVGLHDLAMQLFQSRKFPSWGYEVEQGATSIWERWDSYTKEHGFEGESGKNNASMNSFSHYSFGAVCEWMFQTLAGIDLAEPGYRKLLIRPSPATPGSNPDRESISWVRASYDAPTGKIVSAWKREAGHFHFDVMIPANTTATIELPANFAETITEGDKPLEQAEGVRFVKMQGDRAVIEAGSGIYRFKSNWK